VWVEPDGTVHIDGVDTFVWSTGEVTQHRQVSAHPSTAAGETAYYTLIGHATDPDGLYVREESDGFASQIQAFGGEA
jgi:hypothetical protein